MKIGIITFPLRTNYGGLLQAYALQTVLERMGHEVEIVEKVSKGYRTPWYLQLLAPFYRPFRNLFSKNKVPVFYEYYARRMRYHTDRFIHKYIHRVFVNEYSDAETSKYEGFVVGSDQVWRRAYNVGSISDRFLCFIKRPGIKRVSYAASLGVDYWEYTPEETLFLRDAIQRFDGVSVREDSGVTLCRENLHTEVKHVLDPTMLLDKSDYISLINAVAVKPSAGNLMTYILDENPEIETFIEGIAHQKGLVPFKTTFAQENNINSKSQQQPPVEQWLKSFYDAEFVITDSFHACVFSIIFGKPFIALGNAERGMARFNSLLKMFGLENHLITDPSMYNPREDYHIPEEVYTRLDALRQEARRFLTKALQK